MSTEPDFEDAVDEADPRWRRPGRPAKCRRRQPADGVRHRRGLPRRVRRCWVRQRRSPSLRHLVAPEWRRARRMLMRTTPSPAAACRPDTSTRTPLITPAMPPSGTNTTSSRASLPNGGKRVTQFFRAVRQRPDVRLRQLVEILAGAGDLADRRALRQVVFRRQVVARSGDLREPRLDGLEQGRDRRLLGRQACRQSLRSCAFRCRRVFRPAW